MKADLHFHGPIGFQPHWLKVQGYFGKDENVLRKIADRCFEREIDICAITSEETEIPRGSIHDRFGYMIKTWGKATKAAGYGVDLLGKNVLVLTRKRFTEQDKLYLVNGQTVIIGEKGKRLDHLVVGSNSVPNDMGLLDTLMYCDYNGLIQIAEHPFALSHFGMGEKVLETHLGYYDAVEGHNSQLCLPAFMSGLPVVGNYTRTQNRKAKDFAAVHNKPYVATSDGHRVDDVGISYINTLNQINDASEEQFIGGLKRAIKDKRFTVHEEYEPLGRWLNWVSKFKIGTTLGLDKK